MADQGYKMEAFALMQQMHKSRQLNVYEEMHYYSYVSGVYMKDLKDYDKYIAVSDSMLASLDKHSYSKALNKRYVQAYNMKAEGLFAKGLYNESYDYYYKAKNQAIKTDDSCSLSQLSYSLGMVLFRQQKYLDAAYRFIDALRESAPCEMNFMLFYREQELRDNIGLSYHGIRKYDSALFYYQQALDYIDSNYLRYPKNENAYITAKAVVYGNMGDTYISLGKYDTAVKLLEKSISINLQKGFANSDALLGQVKLTNLFFKNGNIEGMKGLLYKIKAELDSIPDRTVELQWSKLMWQYYDHIHDSMSAYRYLKGYVALNDSFMTSNNYLMTTDLAGRIRSIERQNHINLLQKDNEQAKIYVVIAMFIVTLAMIIVMLVLRNAKRTRNNLAVLTELNNKVKEQNDQLAKALEELEEKDKDKSRILRSVAHDVMNPIAAIMSLTDMIINESQNYSDEHRELLELIKDACANSLGLSKDIIQAAAKIDPAAIAKEPININKLVANSVKLLGIQARTKQQQIFIINETADVVVNINKKQIWRVVNNLLGNAIKFSYEKSSIEIRIVVIDRLVRISIEDHGVGIPDKNKPYVFDMFTEAKAPGTYGEPTHGLGLSISLQIAKAHNGNIWFVSQAEKGTTFYLDLPLI